MARAISVPIYRLVYDFCLMHLAQKFIFAFRSTLRPALVGGLLVLLPLAASAARVIEASAIPVMAFLDKAAFDQRFPGSEIEDHSRLEPGWYVIYEHESLAYYFGPILLRSTGEDYLAELRATVAAAVAKRPSIQGYRLDLRYEPSDAGAESGADTSGEPDNSEAAATPPPPPPPPPSGFWGFIRKIFGF